MALGLASGCTKVPLLAPSSASINLAAADTVLPINGSTQVIATVIESSGTAVQDGTVVTFIPTLGSVKPVDAATVNGKATATFFAGSQSGEATITAISGGAKLVTEGGLKIKIGGAAAETVRVTATPATLPSTGGTAQITAIVSDVNGNPLPGVPVVFSSDAGQLSASTVTTDQSGQARTSVTTNRATKVTATAGSKTAEVAIGINASPAVSISTTTASPIAGQPVSFTVTPGTGVTLRDVVISFGDGDTASLGAITTATSVSHVYSSGGTYTVSATATDTSGETASTSTIVTVAPRTPLNVSIAAAPNPVNVNQVVTFTGSPAPGTTPAPVSYEWNFGDNMTATLTGNTVSHSYSAPGTYTVTLKVTAADGSAGTGQTSVVVNAPAPAAPTASFVFSPPTPTTSTNVQFDASASTGSGLTYSWNFGDTSALGTGNPATHMFATPGTYTVTLTVKDSNNQTATTSKQVTVS